jgi:hypothetical protein
LAVAHSRRGGRGGTVKKRQATPAGPTWTPTFDIDRARPVVVALANAPISNGGQVRPAIAEFVRLSERPPLEKAIRLIQGNPDVLHRPWIWLAAVMQEASAKGDHHLAAAGLFWACYWTSDWRREQRPLVQDLELDPIPDPRKAQIAAVGVAAARELPPDFVVVDDSSGQIQAGPLAESASELLGV